MQAVTSSSESTPPVQSVSRALQLLDAVEAAGGAASISDMASATSLSLGTTHRLAHTLVDAGYLRQLLDRRYCLGSRLVVLGTRANHMVERCARPVLAELAEQLGETANLAVLSGQNAEYLAQAAGRHSMRTFTEVGHRVPLHCTGVGKALLSMLNLEDVRRVLGESGMPTKTRATISELPAMLTELAKIQARGYVVDDEEMELGVRCVAAPVRVPSSLIAVSVSGPAARMTDDFLLEAVPAVIMAGVKLASTMSDYQH